MSISAYDEEAGRNEIIFIIRTNFVAYQEYRNIDTRNTYIYNITPALLCETKDPENA